MKKLFIQPTPAQISARLRDLRRQRGWSLADIERESSGSIKAVVMGSYERGTRSLSIKRALQLAELFDLPINDLLNPESKESSLSRTQKVVIDLRKVISREGEVDSLSMHLNYLLSSIARERGDWNGEILTIRQSDIKTLSMMSHQSEAELLKCLINSSIIISNLQ